MNIDRVHEDPEIREIMRGVYPVLNVEPKTDINALLDWAVKLPEVGVKIVQVRAKHYKDEAVPGVLDELTSHLKGAGLTVILNDYVELVGITGADGVHLGLDDFPVFEARAMLGPKAIVGATVRNHAEGLMGAGQGATYVAAGSVFKSPTKSDAPIIGTEGLREIVEHLDLEAPKRKGWGRRDNVPVCAIGGINRYNLKHVYEAGASMAAMIGAIQGSDDPIEAAKGLVQEWNRLEGMPAEKGASVDSD